MSTATSSAWSEAQPPAAEPHDLVEGLERDSRPAARVLDVDHSERHRTADRVGDASHVGQPGLLERRRRTGSACRRRRRARRRVERLEASSTQPRDSVAPQLPGERRLLHDDEAVRALDARARWSRSRTARACAGRSARPRSPRAASSSAASIGAVAHQLRRDDGDVVAAAHDLGAGRARPAPVVAQLALAVEQALVLEDEHGVVIADRRAQQAVGVGRRGRGDDLEPRDVEEPVLDRLRVLRGEAGAGAVGQPDRDRQPSPGRRSCSGTSPAGWRSGRSRRPRSRRT